MLTMAICDEVHGFAEIPWDYAPVPKQVWDKLRVLPNGCWVAESVVSATRMQQTMVLRITHRSAFNALAITPTCGNQHCANPAHLCLTWANAMSLGDE